MNHYLLQMKYSFLVFFFALGMLGSGCNLVNPAEKTPTYVHIDSMSFTINDPLKEGSASQKITSAWVYFKSEAIGVFDLPVTIPILTDGPGDVFVIPGITPNGLKSYQEQYPFFNTAKLSIDRKPGTIISWTPNTNYLPDTKFQMKEDFEVGNSFTKVNVDKTTDTSITRTDDKTSVFEGNRSGAIYLDATHPTSENINKEGFPIKQGKSFIEINYRGTTSFQVGLQTTVSGEIVYEYLVSVKAKENWNKMYINIASFAAAHQGQLYRVMIKSSLDEGLSSGYVLLDNIKLLSF